MPIQPKARSQSWFRSGTQSDPCISSVTNIGVLLHTIAIFGPSRGVPFRVELCEQAAKEEDSEKLVKLITEINEELDTKFEFRFRKVKDRKSKSSES